ncbi:MAG: lysophospholipid acyltransferase family protein [Bacteroidales bacterium]|nr:lysophospholipid acyltransferase family protein [Bacteroidales bacterium]
MILKSRHHPVIYPFFRYYTKYLLKKHFSKINLIGNCTNENLPVLLLANHFSWWDGFLALYLDMKVFRKKFHFMMLEEQLRKYWFFNYSGGFSVKRNSRSVLESLQYASDMLNDCGNMVLIFPQGEIQSMHQHDFKFEKGVERILHNRPNKLQIVFLACFVDYLSNKKPGLYMYYNCYKGQSTDIQTLQGEYNQFYSESVKQQKLLKE